MRGARRQLRVFGRLLAMNLSMTFVYRGDFLILQIANVVVPVISLLVWRAALSSGAQLGVDGAYLDAYFLLTALVSMLTSSWSSAFLAVGIRNGDLNRWLVRPTSRHLDQLANNLGEKGIKVVLMLPVLVIIAIALPGPFPLDLQPARIPLFLLTLIMATAIMFVFDIIRGSLAFWFEDVSGFIVATDLIRLVLSGAVVPLALMPPTLATVIGWQPFRFTVSLPVEVMLGAVQGGLPLGVAQQVGWLAVMSGLAVLTWKRGLNQYSAAGA